MKHYFTLIIFIFPFTFFAQHIQGTLKNSESGEPIIGIEISTSTNQKSFTNENGNFSFENVTLPITLYFNDADYQTDSLIVKNYNPIIFSLKPSKAQNLDNVVVSASRRKQKIEDVAISMDVLKPELINNKGYAKLDDALGQSPGVYSMDGQISIRGGSGFSYGAGSRVMLLWNGVPMLSADAGDAKWNTVPIELLSSVEVLKGASSVLYGSGALNGIISVSEIMPTTKPYFNAKVQAGIYDNPRRLSLRSGKVKTFQLIEFAHGQKKGNFFYNIGLNLYSNDGFREGEIERRARVTGSVGYNFKKVHGLQTGLGYSFHSQRVGSFLIWESDSLAYRPKGGANYLDPASTLSMMNGFRLMLDPYLKYVGKNNTKHDLKTRFYSVSNQSLSNSSQNSLGNTYYLDYLFQKEFDKTLNLSAGATYMKTQVFSNLYRGNHQADNAAAYVQADSKVGKFAFTAGVRFEYFKQDGAPIDSYSYLKKDSSVKIPIMPIFRGAITYKPVETTILRFSAGQGVRYPATSERYVSTSVGPLNIFQNPNLKKEQGFAMEIGAKQVFKVSNWKGMLDVAGFINQYRNMTEFTFGIYNPAGTILSLDPTSDMYIAKWVGFRAENAEEARIWGAEITFASEGKIGDFTVRSLIGYNYINPVSLNKDSTYRLNFSDTTTNMLKYRFNHLAKADIEVLYKGFSLGLSARYNSYMKNIDRIFEDGVMGIEILTGLKKYRQANEKGALVFDARFGYEFLEHYRVSLIVDNILNAEYVGRPGDIRPPRSFMVQAQFKF